MRITAADEGDRRSCLEIVIIVVTVTIIMKNNGIHSSYNHPKHLNYNKIERDAYCFIQMMRNEKIINCNK